MNVKIFDVDQGNAALIISPMGHTILLDCGHNSDTGFRPSQYLRGLGIDGFEKNLDLLVLSHADQDHISDIHNVSRLNPAVLARNADVSPQRIRQVKIETAGFVEPEVEQYIALQERYNSPIFVPNWGGVILEYFRNDPINFEDLNDLSLVTFARYGNTGLVLPGDLSKQGWDYLINNHPQKDLFRENLKKTNIFVASHHGREDGYSEEIFKFCQPDIIIFSDKGIEHDTQLTQNLYAKHAKGILFSGMGNSNYRYILTTRNDGPIDISTDGVRFTVSI
ncbi:MAG: MBL fold metallo-hydrolase [Candidatus Staskawiczbacteria bacterium]|nr:MBL fold metallo-hydrolase [Candidatus Staskawiczbacteria bacterium]